MEKNIKDFNRCMALVLEKLYQNFPRPTILVVEELDENADKEAIMTYIATIEFLQQEGFIKYKSATTDSIYRDVVLTAKGITLLNAIPETLSEKRSFIEIIKETFKEGSKVALKTVIEAILKESLKW